MTLAIFSRIYPKDVDKRLSYSGVNHGTCVTHVVMKRWDKEKMGRRSILTAYEYE